MLKYQRDFTLRRMEMYKKKSLLISLLLVFALALVGCGGSESKDGGAGNAKEGNGGTTTESKSARTLTDNIIHTANGSNPGTLDPALAQGTHESWILQHLYTGLMTYDKEGKLVPGMAEAEPTVSEDGLTLTFKIKSDVKWSNGDPVTAKDFEYSWTRVLDPDTASIYAYQLYYLKGGQALNEIKKPGIYYKKDAEGKDTTEVDEEVTFTDADTAGLDIAGKSEDEVNQMVYDKWKADAKANLGVKALDDTTLEVTLENPTPYFVDLTAFYTLYPVNQKTVEANPDWAKKGGDSYVCNGPFVLTNWEQDSKIEIAKNENWYNAADVKIDGIQWDILEEINTVWENYDGGMYDMIVDPPQPVVAQSTENGNEELQIGKQAGVYYYSFNTTEKPFNNAKVRNAFSMAIDRKTIVEKITQGGQLPATGLVPTGILDENGKEFAVEAGELIKEDPAEAKKLLEEGLAEEGCTIDDLNGKVLLYNTSESHKKIAQVLQQMFKTNLGVDIQLENAEFNVVLARSKNQDFNMVRSGWVGDYNDPMTFIDLFEIGGSFNDAKYENPEYDALVKKAKSSADQKVRMDAMREANEIFCRDLPIMPIYFYTQPYFVKTYIDGIFKPLLTYPSLIYAEIK